MATESGRTDSSVTESLCQEPYRFDFFQAVRLLERIDRRRQPVGRSADPSDEVARFRAHPSLNFPASQLCALSDPSEGIPDVEVAFMGLTGPLGMLPHPYTELLLDRLRRKDRTLRDFLDLFNHRMVSFFYRAWEKHRFPVAYERGTEDVFTRALLSIVGAGTHGMRERLSVPDQSLVYYGGLISQRPRSASAICAILSDHFGITANIIQFAGQWLRLDDDCLTRLGSANSRLGVDTIAGTRIWDDQSKFRVQLGPLSLQQFMDFLPIGALFTPLSDFAQFLAGNDLDFDAQLVLSAAEVPACVLGGSASIGPRLGWTSWLKTRDFIEDDNQVILSPRH